MSLLCRMLECPHSTIQGWYLGWNLDQALTLTSLKRALASGRRPEIHHSDQGIHYAATAYMAVLRDQKITISMAEVGEAWQNGYAERLIRTIKGEEVDLSDYEDHATPIVKLVSSWSTFIIISAFTQP